MRTITLNDGTVVNGSVLTDGYGYAIYVYLFGMSLMNGFALMSDPTKTSRIVVTEYENETIYEGFTEIASVNSERGNCNLTMRKPVQTQQSVTEEEPEEVVAE